MPVATDVQVESLNPTPVQPVPIDEVGVSDRPVAGELSRAVADVPPGPIPYDTFDVCGGNCGPYSEVIVPSGFASARYSPPLASAKFVCGYPAPSTYGVVSPV